MNDSHNVNYFMDIQYLYIQIQNIATSSAKHILKHTISSLYLLFMSCATYQHLALN